MHIFFWLDLFEIQNKRKNAVRKTLGQTLFDLKTKSMMGKSSQKLIFSEVYVFL